MPGRRKVAQDGLVAPVVPVIIIIRLHKEAKCKLNRQDMPVLSRVGRDGKVYPIVRSCESASCGWSAL